MSVSWLHPFSSLRNEAYSLAIFTYEVYEINKLRIIADDGITIREYKNLVHGSGIANLHGQAVFMSDRAAGQLLVDQGKLSRDEFIDFMRTYQGQGCANNIPSGYLSK